MSTPNPTHIDVERKPRVWQNLDDIPAGITRVHDGWRGDIIWRIPSGWANPGLLTAVSPFTELSEDEQ